jgi:N-acetylneuraminate synthase/sialic acid synthase
VHNEFAILQCTASYPAKYEQLNLKVITRLMELYPENIIGYSGHDNGIAMALVAYTLGARIIEKHFTLNRTLKGTDHVFSLEPQGMHKMVRDLNRAALAIGDGKKIIYNEEIAPIAKMGKMIVAARDLPAGHRITLQDIEYRSPFNGLPPSDTSKVIGTVLKIEVRQFTPLSLEILN